MKILALLPAFVLFWTMARLVKKRWRLLALLVTVSLVGGCANSSNKLEKSPCACEFAPINTGDYGSKTHA
ncbi:hypothetical protein [Caballeronia sp. S22]|uniref:hypothetical protein n=1 Tax=Caballeronia sp. S22 TaxID=3137182 RepID=UPI003530FEE4